MPGSAPDLRIYTVELEIEGVEAESRTEEEANNLTEKVLQESQRFEEYVTEEIFPAIEIDPLDTVARGAILSALHLIRGNNSYSTHGGGNAHRFFIITQGRGGPGLPGEAIEKIEEFGAKVRDGGVYRENFVKPDDFAFIAGD